MRCSKISLLAAALLLSAAPLGAEAAPPGTWTYKGFTQWHANEGSTALGAAGTQCFFCKPDQADGDDDRDGVPNSLDKCPNTPKGEKVDAVGCSLPGDSDKDGVIDSEDKCPNTPTGATVNKVGCWVLNNLNFLTNSAKIEPKGEGVLRDAAKVLKANPGLKVEIQGHTDDVGSAPYNKKLSQARANAVKQHLIKQGIQGARLTTQGYGMEKPVASNATEPGRAENRRVELKILQ